MEVSEYFEEDASIKSYEKSIKIRKEGNKLYAKKKHGRIVHLDILSLYNQSAALAKNNSEELALAINNRSVLLMHIHKYKEALNDIDKAYGITKSDKLKSKLFARKTTCLLYMETLNKEKNLIRENKSKIPAIYQVSKTIPCASNCVSINYDKKFGRHIVATKDIELGTIIVKEKAVVLLPTGEKFYTNCSHCLMLSYNGVPCDHCSVIIYCSEKCKQEAWVQYHDIECSVFQYFKVSKSAYEIFEHLLFTFRLFIKYIKNEGLQNVVQATVKIEKNHVQGEFLKGFYENKIFQSDKFQSFYNLSHNKEINELEEVNNLYRPFIRDIIKILATKTNIFNDYQKIINDTSFYLFEVMLYKLKRIIDQNAYSFQEVCLYESVELCEINSHEKIIGTISTPFSSLFNHSCNQNAGRAYTDNQEVFIYTTQPIKKGDQIFVNYGTPTEMKKKLRQEKLKLFYNFTCECEACTNDWPSDANEFLNNVEGFKLLYYFKNHNVSQSALNVYFGDIDKVSYNSDTLKEVKKMSQIIEKTSNQASLYQTRVNYFFDEYYNKLYKLQTSEIPDSC